MIVQGNVPFVEPPLWAVLERQLFALMNGAAEPLLEKYVRPDGSVLWPTTDDHVGIDALDDAYESFHNWPLFYLLGGEEKFLDWSRKAFDAITAQFAKYDSGHGHPMVVKEYEQGYDWFHQGEGYLFFYLLCVADPRDARNAERARRFAGLYMNEDPDAPNYDEERNLIRCAHTGSMGPGYRNFTGEPWGFEEWKIPWGLPYYDIPGVLDVEDLKDPANAEAMGKAIRDRAGRGDTPINLAATTMAAVAYVMTGDEKYRQWALRYIDGWLDRLRENGGILPDNIGLGGVIGEYSNGKWHGGNYGWTWPHGWDSLGNSLVIAAGNGYLLSGDDKYLELLRSQLDLLTGKGIENEGTLHVPHRYGAAGNAYRNPNAFAIADEQGDGIVRDGWFEFRPMDDKFAAHLWMMSMERDDLDRSRKLLDLRAKNWERVSATAKKDQSGNEAAWVAYLQGEFPEYPERILSLNIRQVYDRLRFMREDTQDPSTYRDWYLQVRNPIVAEGLVQLTLGGLLPEYNGGLPQARIAYEDPERGRPGLPSDVAALVEAIGDRSVRLKLVNLHPAEERTVVLKAGAFEEHRFTSIAYERRAAGGGTENVREACDDGGRLEIRLTPGCEFRAEIGMRRYANAPRLNAYPRQG